MRAESHFGDRNRSFIYVFGIDKAGNSDFTGLTKLFGVTPSARSCRYKPSVAY